MHVSTGQGGSFRRLKYAPFTPGTLRANGRIIQILD